MTNFWANFAHISETFLDGRHKMFRNIGPGRFIGKVKLCVLFHRQRLSDTDDTTILAGAASLSFMKIIELDRSYKRLSEGHFRLAESHRTIVFALHSLAIDLEMQFTHAGDNHLAAIVVPSTMECW